MKEKKKCFWTIEANVDLLGPYTSTPPKTHGVQTQHNMILDNKCEKRTYGEEINNLGIGNNERCFSNGMAEGIYWCFYNGMAEILMAALGCSYREQTHYKNPKSE